MTRSSPLARVASRPLSTLLLLTLISLTAACSSGAGSTAAPPLVANDPPPPPPQITGIAMPSSVAVVTATNAQ